MEELNIGVRINLEHPEDFLLVKESLTRIGVPSKQSKTLFQSAHILHKRGLYYICHFKELFYLDGKPSSITDDDIARRNLIVYLLEDWGLVTVVNLKIIENKSSLNSLKILSFKEKSDWILTPKYTLGNKSNY